MKVRRTKENMYAVIGLGRFGFALAQRLAESGAELIVVDKRSQSSTTPLLSQTTPFW